MKSIRYFLLSCLILSSLVVKALAYYHPDEGRWLNRDPLGDERHATDSVGIRRGVPKSPPPPTLYVFVRNRTIDMLDPLGLLEWKSWGQSDCDNNRGVSKRAWASGPRESSSAAAFVTCTTLPFYRNYLCDTETRIWVKARHSCCRTFLVTCSWQFQSQWTGYDGYAGVHTTIGSAKSYNLGDSIRGYAKGATGPGRQTVLANWQDTKVKVLEIGNSWVDLLQVVGEGGAYTERAFWPGAEFSELITGGCSAQDVGPCH